MNARGIASLVLILVLSGLFAFLAVASFREAAANLDESSPLLSAPRIATEEGLAGRENEIVWLKGRLAPAAEASILRAPLSQAVCLYYSYGKYAASWETDSDGDYVRVWTEVESDTQAPPLALKLGGRALPIHGPAATYHNLVTSADFIRTIDSAEYHFRESVIPIENSAWVTGRLAQGGISGTGRGIIISLFSADNIIRQLKGWSAILFFFSILCGVAGAGFLTGFTGRLLAALAAERDLFPQPGDIAYGFGSAGFLWLLAGLFFAALSAGAVLVVIIGWSVIIAGFLPLLVLTGRAGFKPLPALFTFAPALGLTAGAGALFHQWYYSLEAGPLTFAAGALLQAGAVALLLAYRVLFVGKSAPPPEPSGRRRTRRRAGT